MKYYVFSFALLGVIPLALLLFLNSRWMKFALWGMALAMFAWQGTAINFLSHEEYRGSARGMEVSLLYLLSFALLLALLVRGKVRKAVPDGGFWMYVLQRRRKRGARVVRGLEDDHAFHLQHLRVLVSARDRRH